MNTRAEIERFILDELMSGERNSIDPDEPLISTGTLDSLGMLRLITFLEERFGLKIGDGEVGDENFGTLARLANFVERKHRETGSA